MRNAIQLTAIGAKAAGLQQLRQAGFQLPPFNVIPFSFLNQLSTDQNQAIAAISSYIETFELQGEYFAVRSSSANEDGENESFAGQFKTLLGIPTSNLPEAIWEVFMHFKTVSLSAYSNQVLRHYAILVQSLVEPDFSGVAFSSHPTDPAQKEPQITIVPGGGEALVSGRLEALTLTFESGKWQSDQFDQFFSGETLIDKNKLPPKAGSAILQANSTHLNAIKKELRKLEQSFGKPVDVEFAIQNNQLFWLQVRPITTIGPPTLRVYDATVAEANYHGISLPLTLDFVQRSFYLSYRNLAKKLCISDKTGWIESQLSHMSIGFQGVLYYNVTAWQQLIAQLPFGKKAASYLPKLWGMEPVRFDVKQSTTIWQKTAALFGLMYFMLITKSLKKKYKKKLTPILDQSIDLSKMHIDQLRMLYKNHEAKLASNWLAPSINGFYALLFMKALKKHLASSQLLLEHPNFANDIFQRQTNVITVKMVHDFQGIVQCIKELEGCNNWFQTVLPNTIWENLPHQYPELNNKIVAYLNAYGVKARNAELKMETETFSMLPVSFIEYLQQNLDIPPIQAANPLHYQSVIRSEYGIFHPKRHMLLFLVKQCILRIGDRENYRFDRTRAFAHLRNILCRIEQELILKNRLEKKGDSFYLTVAQMIHETELDLKEIVNLQRENYTAYKKQPLIIRYRETINGMEAVSSTYASTDLKGIGCCSGIVKGEIILHEDIQPDMDISKKIVVAAFFEPGEIALFTKAAGLLSARGNILSHTAILCRELGIPSIVGIKGLLTQLKTGDWVEMNGSTGQLKRIEQ